MKNAWGYVRQDTRPLPTTQKGRGAFTASSFSSYTLAGIFCFATAVSRAEKERARALEAARAELRAWVWKLTQARELRAELPPAMAREVSRAIQSRASLARETYSAACLAAEEGYARALEEARVLKARAKEALEAAARAIQALGFRDFAEARAWYLARAELARHLARSRKERAKDGSHGSRKEGQGQKPLSLHEARDRLMRARSRAQMAFEVIRVRGQDGKKIPVLVVRDLGSGYRAQVPKSLVDAVRQGRAGAEEKVLAWAEEALRKARKGQKQGQKARAKGRKVRPHGRGNNGHVPDTAMAYALAKAGIIQGPGAQK